MLLFFTDSVHLSCDHRDLYPQAGDPPRIDRGALDALHAFARCIDVRRHWYEAPTGGSYPHYDLTHPDAAERAIRGGAVLVETREFLILTKPPGSTRRPADWTPKALGTDLDNRIWLARASNLRLMRRFRPRRRPVAE